MKSPALLSSAFICASVAAGSLAMAVTAAPRPAAKPMPINWAKGTPTTVTMTNKGYAPHRLVMHRGGHYVLSFHNLTDRPHTFAAKDFFAEARVSPADQNWIPHNEVELRPHESAVLHLIAPTTPNAIYVFKSNQIADAVHNFKGEIVVR